MLDRFYTFFIKFIDKNLTFYKNKLYICPMYKQDIREIIKCSRNTLTRKLKLMCKHYGISYDRIKTNKLILGEELKKVIEYFNINPQQTHA